MSDADTLKELGRLRTALKKISGLSVVDVSLDPGLPARIADKSLGTFGNTYDGCSVTDITVTGAFFMGAIKDG